MENSMIFKKVTLLLKLYLIFIDRKVLNKGIVRLKVFKVAATGMYLSIQVYLFVLLWHFLNPRIINGRSLSLINMSYGLTVMMWTTLIFMIMKLFFINDKFYSQINQTFPVTSYEKGIAKAIFEFACGLTVVFFVSITVVAVLLSRYGFSEVQAVFTNVFLMSLSWYVLLDLIYMFLFFVFQYFGLSSIRNSLNTSIFLLLFLFMYVNLTEITGNLVDNYVNHRSHIPLLLFWDFLNSKIGLLGTIVSFLLFLMLGLLSLIFLDSKIKYQESKYINLLTFKKRDEHFFGTYSLLRDVDNLTYVILSAVAFLFIQFYPNTINHFSVYACCVLSVTSFYQYEHTTELRLYDVLFCYSAIKDYFRMLTGELSYEMLCIFPLILIFLTFNNVSEWGNIGYMAIGLISSNAVFTTLGILFPPKMNNPFSGLIAGGILFLFLTISAFSLIIFEFPYSYLYYFGVLLVIANVIAGICVLRKERFSSYEKL